MTRKKWSGLGSSWLVLGLGHSTITRITRCGQGKEAPRRCRSPSALRDHCERQALASAQSDSGSWPGVALRLSCLARDWPGRLFFRSKPPLRLSPLETNPAQSRGFRPRAAGSSVQVIRNGIWESRVRLLGAQKKEDESSGHTRITIYVCVNEFLRADRPGGTGPYEKRRAALVGRTRACQLKAPSKSCSSAAKRRLRWCLFLLAGLTPHASTPYHPYPTDPRRSRPRTRQRDRRMIRRLPLS